MTKLEEFETAFNKLKSAHHEAWCDFDTVAASDGVQLLSDLTRLVKEPNQETVALSCSAATALISSLQHINNESYTAFVNAVAEFGRAALELIISGEPVPDATVWEVGSRLKLMLRRQ